MTGSLTWRWLGRQPYEPVHQLQLQLRRDILAGTGDPTLLLVEHDPVVTLGRRGSRRDLAAPRDVIEAQGVAVIHVERGGLATYHGPGQLVGYPVIPLPRLGLTVPSFVSLIEGVLIDYVGSLGLQARRREAYPGVWVGRSKIAAIGLHVHRGVSIHGFALNLTVDPDAYRAIVPCGIPPRQGTVSSVAAEAGTAPAPREAAAEVARRLICALVE